MNDPSNAKLETRPLLGALSDARDQFGLSLLDLSSRQPLLIVFLRHAGCTFCREALHELRSRRAAIEALGTRLVLVHMTDDAGAVAFFSQYNVADVSRIADPEQTLYRAFDLQRGSLWQLLGPKVWWRGFVAGILKGHGVGTPRGDVYQMPGAFLVHKGEIIRSFRHASASDRPEYDALACPINP